MITSIDQYPMPVILAKQAAIFKLTTNLTVPVMFIAYVQNSGTDQVQAVNKMGQFDLSEYLDIFEYTETPIESGVVRINLPSKTVTFYDKEIGNPALPTPVITDPYFILNGRIPKSRMNAVYSGYDSFLNYIYYNKTCLTWHPFDTVKKIHATTPEYLYFMVAEALQNNTHGLKLRLYFTDGTTEDIDDKYTVSALDQFDTIEFAVGFTELGIQDYIDGTEGLEGKTIDFYDVFITNENGVVTDKYRYKPVFDAEDPRTLIFKNPYGFPETVFCTGRSSVITKLSFESARTDGKLLPDSLNFSSSRERTVTANTGFITKEQAQWLAELLDTTEAFELIEGALHPITLLDIDIAEHHTDDYLYSAEIKYQCAYIIGEEKG